MCVVRGVGKRTRNLELVPRGPHCIFFTHVSLSPKSQSLSLSRTTFSRSQAPFIHLFVHSPM